MRDFQKPGRSAAYGQNGMVATSHPIASYEAARILTEGGSAADAAIVAASVLCVAEPQMTGIGGDCFWMHANSAGDVLVYNGSGRTPAAATKSYLSEREVVQLQPWSPHTVTIPGAVEAWCRLHAEKGSLPLERLLGPAITLAQDGCLVHPRVALDWAYFRDRAERTAEARSVFLPQGTPLRRGDRFANPALARTLGLIAQSGPNAFYRGAVAESLVKTLNSMGGLHTLDDFDRHIGEFVSPIRTRYRGLAVLECPPNGQGMAALILLNILSQFDMSERALDEAGRTHVFAEATKLAYADRNRWCADPGFSDLPVDHLLSDDHAKLLADQIDMAHAAPAPKTTSIAHRDTVYFAIVDRNLNVVSFINSIFHGFGSGIFDPATGVLLHNRGLGFCFEQGHANCFDRAKRPLHTIIPALAADGQDRPQIVFGVMGGQYQACGHAQLISHIVDRGMGPQEAIDQPRSFAWDGALEIEHTHSDRTFALLRDRGHVLHVAPEPIGGAQAIQIDYDRGILVGGSDPRKDGLAIGL